MMRFRKIMNVLVLWGIGQAGMAQPLLTMADAIGIALENNYDIKLAQYDTEAQKNRVSRALSGQMPTLTHEMSATVGYSDTETEILNTGPGEGRQPPLSLNGTSNELLVQPQLTVPLFNGLVGRYTFQKLQNASQISLLQRKSVTEQVVLQTVEAYIQAARHQSKLAIDRDNINISAERLERMAEQNRYGGANALQTLQTVVDLKTDSVTYMDTALAYANAKRNLNLVLGRGTEEAFLVEEEAFVHDSLAYSALKTDMMAKNTTLQLSERDIYQAEQEWKISKGSRLPNVQAFANLTYRNAEDEANFLQSNRVFGPKVGIQLSLPVFTGGVKRIERQNAEIFLSQSKTRRQDTQQRLGAQLANTFAQYQHDLARLRIAQANLRVFEANFEKASADNALGLADALVLRTAQLNLASAKNRVNTRKYNIKISETQLMLLSGRL